MRVWLERPAFRRPHVVAAVVIGAALVAWIVTVERMRGMDMGPGTDLRELGWFLGVWLTMMAAMMLPSVLPMVLLFAKVSAERTRRRADFVPTWTFVAGYLAVWGGAGFVGFALYGAIAGLDFGFLAWDRQGPLVAGVAVAAAGVYELTPLKSVCLRHCRSPMHFILGGWREGHRGAVRMAAEHGAYCVGCCWGLMVVLFTLGVMSITWMAIVASIVLAQKVMPFGVRLVPLVGVALIALGVWIGVDADSVPLLVNPHSDGPPMGMEP